LTPLSPSWADIEEFLRADGWRQLAAQERGGKQQSHIFFEKVLSDGRVLQTHSSHSRQKSVSSGRFQTILRFQLEVSRQEFWECIRSGTPVPRPVDLREDAPVEHEPWVIEVLVRDLHLSAGEIEALSTEEAQDLVHRHWSGTS
jgi:hypothetical protein